MGEPQKKISLNVVPDGEAMSRKIDRAENNQRSRPQEYSSSSSPIEPEPLMPPSDWPIERKLLHGKIVATLKTIYDPEIPIDIYELGLIYNIDISSNNAVILRMTLTAPACPVAGEIVAEVESKIENLPEILEATVELVWDPPWSKDRMSEAARLQLGF